MRRRDILFLCLIPFVVTGLLAGVEHVARSKSRDERTALNPARRTEKLELATMTREAYRGISKRLRDSGIDFTIRVDQTTGHFKVIVLLRDADAAAAICWDYHARHPDGLVSMNTYR